jgi:Ca2+-binding EF-hand superfamily protein
MSKRKTVLIIAGALLTVGAVAAISAPGDRGHRMGPMFGGWGDGGMGGKGRWSRQPMTEEEFDANTRARFARLDRNSDGVIDASEIEAELAQRATRHRGKGERGGERMLRRFDTDRDGKVTKDEFTKDVGARFAELDLNNDGRITDEDLPPAMRGRGVLTGSGEVPRRGMGRRIQNLREADANKDGIITRDEVMAAAERRFASLDRNKDDALDKGDADALRKETADYRVQRFMHRFGVDRDGKVTKEQFFAKAKERFARLDRDGDGTVSRGERGWSKDHRWYRRGGLENETPAEQGGDPAPRNK